MLLSMGGGNIGLLLGSSYISPDSCLQITFEVENTEEHYHIPLLISPYSFTTYRGS
jgi:5-hydroxyisourate hydrolase